MNKNKNIFRPAIPILKLLVSGDILANSVELDLGCTYIKGQSW